MEISNDDISMILPGRIVTYYPNTQTADIQISAERVFSNIDGKEQVGIRQELKGVMVQTPYGGGWSITFPIGEGDSCIVMFSQIGFDHWMYEDKDTGGSIANQPVPHLKRQFSEDDGVAMVGFNTLPRAIQGYHPLHSQWRNEDVTQLISLNQDGSITVSSQVDVTINAPEITLNGGSVVNINTPTTNISGDLNVGGSLVTTNTGVTMNGHVHDGDSGGTTGVPR